MAGFKNFDDWMAGLRRVMHECGDPTDPHPDKEGWRHYFDCGKTPEQAYYAVVVAQGYGDDRGRATKESG